jgi:hypothetical protein
LPQNANYNNQYRYPGYESFQTEDTRNTSNGFSMNNNDISRINQSTSNYNNQSSIWDSGLDDRHLMVEHISDTVSQSSRGSSLFEDISKRVAGQTQQP